MEELASPDTIYLSDATAAEIKAFAPDRIVLLPLYPQLEDMRLVDYKVRILTPQAGTRAITRVMIESADSNGRRWTTVGVSTNVIDASYNALHDAITYKLYRDGAKAE